MTKEQWYERLLQRCKDEFEDIKNHLVSKPMPYIGFESIQDNRLEFKMGNRRVLLIHEIDIKNFVVIFKTYEIVMNEEDYGKHKLKEISSLAFHSVPSETYYVGVNNEQVWVPKGYLNSLEKHFDTI